MVPHETGKSLGDHGLAHRLENVNQVEIRAVALGNDPGPIGDPTTHRRQVDAGNYPHRSDPGGTEATLTRDAIAGSVKETRPAERNGQPREVLGTPDHNCPQ